ncbi:hypothetical protein [Neorhizobium galegae]|uniref:hypothetical protein n=1 Tax=Neorhizobium galegae TaxID=399 RepID=UPI0006211E2D|nr:hypothetical protein [Neorhizobium galegae]CDZ54020.1 Hypothetical protein NGAL_HAMBI2427_54430 [Neorhizobium galegae bv. orientalis]
MSAGRNFHPSDIFYQLCELAQLIQASNDILHEMDYVLVDGSRNEELDRVSALVKIAKRETERLCDMAEVFDGPSEWRRVSDIGGGAND